MFKNSFIRKFFGIIGTMLISLNCFAWRDTVAHYVSFNSNMRSTQFNIVLKKLPSEQRKILWQALNTTVKEPGFEVTAEKLKDEFIWASSHWITYSFKSNADYHEEVKYVAKKLGVHNAECETATTFQLERRIMEKIFANLWDKLSQEQRKQVLQKAGIDSSNVAGYASLTAAGLLATLGTTAAIMGFPFYIIVAETIVVAAAALFGASAATTIGVVATLCGPIGWGIAAIAAAGGAILLGGPDVTKTASFIVAFHVMKVEGMKYAGFEIAPYLLK